MPFGAAPQSVEHNRYLARIKLADINKKFVGPQPTLGLRTQQNGSRSQRTDMIGRQSKSAPDKRLRFEEERFPPTGFITVQNLEALRRDEAGQGLDIVGIESAFPGTARRPRPPFPCALSRSRPPVPVWRGRPR